VIKYWISNHTSDFTSDTSLLTSVLEIVDILSKDGMESEKAKIVTAMEQKRLDTQGRTGGDPNSHAATLASEEPGKVTLRKKVPEKSKGFRFSLRSSSKDLAELPTQEPFSPIQATAKDLKKVFMVDETYKTIELGPFTTGLEALETALSKFNNPQNEQHFDVATYELCELKSDGGVRVIEPDEVSLGSKISLNGRLFLRKRGTEDKVTAAPELAGPESPFLEMETNELARISTLHDHQLFCRIDPLEFINHIFKMKGKDTTNLNNFVNQFNRLNYWVVSEICSQPKLEKRVLQIKKFINLCVVSVFLLLFFRIFCYFFFIFFFFFFPFQFPNKIAVQGAKQLQLTLRHSQWPLQRGCVQDAEHLEGKSPCHLFFFFFFLTPGKSIVFRTFYRKCPARWFRSTMSSQS